MTSGRLASNFQLWRLNKEGRLELRDTPGEPLTSEEVHPLVASIMAAYEQAKANE